jgi:hypothetical protein
MRDGRCVPSALPSNCQPGQTLRDGRCVPSALPSNCQPGQTLRDGRCVPSALPSNCQPGQTLRDGRCVAGSDIPPTVKHPTTCGSGETLRDGKCTSERRPVLKPTPNLGRRWSNIPRATRSPPSFRRSFRGGGYRGGSGGHGSGGHGGGGHSGGRRSDIRLKHDIVTLGRLDNGLGFYRFSYNGSDKAYVGVMAQEVQAVMPEAVARGSDGYLLVYYRRLGFDMQTWDAWVASGRKIPRTAPVRH